MGIEVTITPNGQVSFDEAILSHLGVPAGGRLELVLKPNGRVELHGIAKRPVLADLRGILAREGAPPVSLEEMQRAIEDVQL